jgi:hypothetical protein
VSTGGGVTIGGSCDRTGHVPDQAPSTGQSRDPSHQSREELARRHALGHLTETVTTRSKGHRPLISVTRVRVRY